MVWLVMYFFEGGFLEKFGEFDDDMMFELLDTFFVLLLGVLFRDVVYYDLLLKFIDMGSGDLMRWSSICLWDVLSDPFYDDDGSLEVAIDVLVLLRVYIPFVYVCSGIQQYYTDETIVMIDEMSRDYCRCFLIDVACYVDYDDFEPLLWLICGDQVS